MHTFHANSAIRSLSRAQQLREAVLLIFCDPFSAVCERLFYVSSTEWLDLLHWLDTSGLALLFLDRLRDLELLGILPSPVLARLQNNLTDNSRRMDEMIVESVAMQCRFQQAGLSYAVLKGFSLWPVSVPKLELRSQLDIDFLVAEESANEARRILEEIGYRLHAASGRSMDFKADEGRTSGLKDLYIAGSHRSAELHIEHVPAGQTSLLSRTQKLYLGGICMPILPPIDLFLGQGLHLYKHVCSQFSRAAHLIEFRRHIIARHDDYDFWDKLRRQVSGEPTTCLRLGVVIFLITRVMGRFAPEALTSWTVDLLPATAKLWVDKYGHRTALATFPGNKLYLLLEKELEAMGLPVKVPLLRALVPRRLPPSIVHRAEGEALLAYIYRHRRQILFILSRLRFSTMEGIRYCRESVLWRQYRDGLS